MQSVGTIRLDAVECYLKSHLSGFIKNVTNAVPFRNSKTFQFK